MATETPAPPSIYHFMTASMNPGVDMYVWPKTGTMPPENVTDPMVVKAVTDEYIEVAFLTDNETCSTFKIMRQPMWVAAGRII